VLRFVNSPYFGFSQEVSSVKSAITLVGMRKIKNFVLWSAVFSQVPDPRCGQFHLKQLWEDSLRRALFARELVTLFGSNVADDAFSAALLQDMAVPLLSKGAPALYARLLEARDHGGTRLSALE
jgi:HD-like signal output (HDOD) protein